MSYEKCPICNSDPVAERLSTLAELKREIEALCNPYPGYNVLVSYDELAALIERMEKA